MKDDLICSVISIFPFDIREEKPGLFPGRFHIPASKNEEPTVLHLGTSVHYVYLDETRGSLQVRTLPTEIAKSIVNDFIGSQLAVNENCHPGLFWAVGELSLEDITEKFSTELRRIKVAQLRWFQEICRLADNDWNRYHQHNVISDTQRKIAEIIKLDKEKHEWMNQSTTIDMSTCPACGTAIRHGIIVCPQCQCVLDKERYEKLSFATAKG